MIQFGSVQFLSVQLMQSDATIGFLGPTSVLRCTQLPLHSIEEMSKIPEIPRDVGLTAAAAAAISENVSTILDSATTAAATAAPASVAIRTVEGITGLDTFTAAAAASSIVTNILEDATTTAAAISNTVAGMLESATTTAAGAVSEVPLLQTSATEAASTVAVAATTAVPPLSPPGSNTEHPMGSIELSSGCDDRGDERGTVNDTNPVVELQLKVESPPSPTLQQPRKDSAAVDAAKRSPKNQRELAPVILSDAGCLFDTDVKLNHEKGRDEKKQKDDEQEDKGMEENQDSQEKEKREGKGVTDERGDTKGETLERHEDCDGRVVLASGPEDGASVWVSGRREGAVVQVVERLRPLYQLIISVTVPAQVLLARESKGGHFSQANIHLQSIVRGSNQGGEERAAGSYDAVVAVSLSLRKSDLKAALESWVHSSVFTAARSGITVTSRPSSDGIERGDEKTYSPDEEAAAAADVSLRTWITTGRAPRRAHLVSWLLQRLEIVRATAAEGGNSDGAREAQEQGRLYSGESSASARWTLVISKDRVNVDGRTGNKARRQQVGCVGRLNEDGEASAVSPHSRMFPGAAGGSTIANPHIFARDIADGAEGREEEVGRGEHQWRWWDEENPWSRGSKRSSTKSSKLSADGSLSEAAPPPPAYQETVSPPPYQQVVRDISAPRSSTQKTVFERHLKAQSPETAATGGHGKLLDSVLSNGASSSEDDTSRGAPPSYRTAAAGRIGTLFKCRSEEGQQELQIKDLPRPSCGRFYGEGHLGTIASPPRRVTDSSSSSKSSSAKSEPAKWWTRGGDDDDHRHRHHRQRRPKPAPDREQERVRERRHERRRRHVSTEGGSYDELQAFDSKTAQRPETLVGDHDGMEGMFGGTWGWRSRYGDGGRRRSLTATGGSRPRTTLSLPRGKKGHNDTPPSGTESWDEDRWRLTRHLEACKRELTEAEEGRRRAEAAANAAERSAWAATQDGDGDTAKRAWARTATQRVLDLMLVTERVRQEEQKRRVAAARASSQVARCKQPFRERRGRSQKGPLIGPKVPPADVPAQPLRSQQRVEGTAMKDFYWDEHGRRFARRGERVDNDVDDRGTASGEVGVATETVRKVAAACLEEGMDFGQPFRDMDADGDGRLTLAELGAALRRAGSRLSLSQVTALFRHFDAGLGLDTISRGEFLWEFCDTRRLLKQWRRAGDMRGGHRGRTAPFRDRVRRASYGGSGFSEEGTLNRHDLWRALDELGIQVDGWEADALLDRFAVEDGSEDKVDWQAFVLFMEAAEDRKDSNNIDGNIGNTSTAKSGKERKGAFHTNFPFRGKRDDGFRHKRHWATSGLDRGGGLFEGGGNTTNTWSDPTRPTEATAPKIRNSRSGSRSSSNNKGYSHWASSVPSSAAGLRSDENATGNTKSPKTRKRATDGAMSWEMMMANPRSGPLRPREGDRDRHKGGMGGRIVANVADASRLLDGLLEDQRELEEFLEEEFAKRESAAAGESGGRVGGGGGLSQPQHVG